jgi:diketogulonate reductase-like aldo/keto reductase
MEITGIDGKVKLNNGVEMPYFGLGVFQADNDKEVVDAVNFALDAGYRHIDTAAIYKNETGVGKAIAGNSVDREDIFITTKVWNADQGYDNTIAAFKASLKALQLEYIDLYLIHWPVQGKFIETWKALEFLYSGGYVRAIGVSNFLQHHLVKLMQSAQIAPMVNQMEFHPWLVQQSLLDFCKTNHIQYEAWSPLTRGKIFGDKTIVMLTKKYGKTPAQILLRWDLQKGVLTIPKSVNKERISSNAQIFDFEISPEDMSALDALDENRRIGPDPDNFDF